MNAMEFWRDPALTRSEGIARAKFVCQQADCGYEYFKHICHGRKRPSAKMALALEKASNGLMGFRDLLTAPLLSERNQENRAA